LQPQDSLFEEPIPPKTDSVSIEFHFVGDGQVTGLVLLSGPQDDASPPGQCLGRGTGSDQNLQLLLLRR
jgi:hypothetical protein